MHINSSSFSIVSADNPPDVIGMNQLNVSTKNDPPPPDYRSLLQSDINRLNISTFYECGALVDVFERYIIIANSLYPLIFQLQS